MTASDPACTCPVTRRRIPHNARCPRCDGNRQWSIEDRAAARPRLVISAPDNDHVVIEVDGNEVAWANHDEHGWSGMDAVVRAALGIAEAVGLTVADIQ